MSEPLCERTFYSSSAVDFTGKFKQFNLLLASGIKNSELLRKKSYEFKIKEPGEASAPATLTSPQAVLLPPLQGFSFNVAFVLRPLTLCDIVVSGTP